MVSSRKGLRRMEKERWPHVDPRKMYVFLLSPIIHTLKISSGLWEERPSVRNHLVICLTAHLYVPLAPQSLRTSRTFVPPG